MLHFITADELHDDIPKYLKYVVERGDTIRIVAEFGNAVLISETDYLALRDAKLKDIANDIMERHKEAFQALANYDGSEPSGYR